MSLNLTNQEELLYYSISINEDISFGYHVNIEEYNNFCTLVKFINNDESKNDQFSWCQPYFDNSAFYRCSKQNHLVCLTEQRVRSTTIGTTDLCYICAGSTNLPRNIIDYHLLAYQHNAKFLGTNEIKNGVDTLIENKISRRTCCNNSLWVCNECNFKIKKAFNGILNKFLCSGCKKNKSKNDESYGKRKTLIDYQNLASKKEITLEYVGIKINDKYILNIPCNTDDSNAYWKCLTCNKIRPSSFNNIKRCIGCLSCIGHAKILLPDYQKIAIDRGGRYLGLKKDDNYIMDIPGNTSSPTAWWKCNTCEFEWAAPYTRIQQNKWCSSCFGNSKKQLENFYVRFSNSLLRIIK